MLKTSVLTVLAVAACGSAGAAMGEQCVKESPPHVSALLELYTSEGCSSCPPADRWFSQLKGAGDSVVPLAFHVDYWDRLGWKDQFANPRFSERQHELAAISGERVVYTPGVFLNLHAVADWRSRGGLMNAVRAANGKPAAAKIRVEIDRPTVSQLGVTAQFAVLSGSAARAAQAYVAVYENNLWTDVKAGENSGAKLRHDYVVREWWGPTDVDRSGEVRRQISIPESWKPRDLGVAAFVQDSRTGEVLQAVALPICGHPSRVTGAPASAHPRLANTTKNPATSSRSPS
jgi:hypothetical protein